ncbi:MAG: NTP transferase domain-containing protein [Bacillota bacterium]|nr:NTP transferase domain-containing protein [Bacillota bacterium]
MPTSYCAVVSAAQIGLRHNFMKPLLALNGSTVVKNAIEALRAMNCKPLIVVSGRNSADLIRHLGRKNLVHIVNRDFNRTNSFYSACLGFAEVPKDIDQVFFLPAEVPLMNKDSLVMLAQHMQEHPELDILRPTRGGKIGHPLLMKRAAVDYLLNCGGEGTMREALAAYPGRMGLLELDDEGMQLDVDVEEDFQCFLAYAQAQAQQQPLNCRADIILGRDKPFFNSLLATLLRQIELTGSLSTACAKANISYSNGWKSIKSAEIQLGFELLESSRGGSSGGVSRLTANARELLRRYDSLEEQISRLCSDSLLDYFADTN